ncbi:MAG TPA: hypothetical protein VMC07_00420 [Candidatus Omnitrophota bacterium]|nr:hypothetical protein [Candidatus Omnitrophota bacterium]
MAKEYNLSVLKQEFRKLQEKYGLPGFEELNREFSIEKIAESETEVLTKEIRRFISDKIYNYIRFIETIINPVNAPIFIFSILKSITPDDKKKLGEIYDKLADIEMELIKLDIESSEKKDAEFIKKVYDSWLEIKRELLSLFDRLKKEQKGADSDNASKYFG